MLLEVKNLVVKAGSKEILKGISLKIKKGEKVALLGPNGSGKTVLAQVILGNKKYQITQGEIYFNNKKITHWLPEIRVKAGISIAWQFPPKITGIKFQDFITKISKSTKIKDFNFSITSLLNNDLNTNISGGEKKISELLQITALKPKLVILDEIDSGVDFKNLKKIVEIIKKELIQKGVTVLFITHNGQILNYLKPDKTLVMVQGKIICQSKDYKIVLNTIKKYGYEKCKKCPFLSDR